MEKRTFESEKSLEQANKIESINDRIIFLKKEIKEFNQQDSWVVDFGNFEKSLNEEIKFLKEINKNNKTIHLRPVNKIWWQKSNRLLGHLFEELAKKGYINSDIDINKTIKEHFEDKNKKPFTDSIKQNRSGSGNNKNSKPKGSNEIDNIINNLKD